MCERESSWMHRCRYPARSGVINHQTFIYVQPKQDTFFKPVKRIVQRTYGHEHTLSLNRQHLISLQTIQSVHKEISCCLSSCFLQSWTKTISLENTSIWFGKTKSKKIRGSWFVFVQRGGGETRGGLTIEGEIREQWWIISKMGAACCCFAKRKRSCEFCFHRLRLHWLAPWQTSRMRRVSGLSALPGRSSGSGLTGAQCRACSPHVGRATIW